MRALLFQRNGVVLDGTYLPGTYRYASGVRLVSAELTGCRRAPTAGTLRLELEVGGTLTGIAFEVSARNGETRQSRALGVLVAAGQAVRWRAAFTGEPAEAAAGVAITVAVGPVVGTVTPTLGVDWTDGSARVRLYAYRDGWYQAVGTGRATVTTTGSEVWLDGVRVMRAGPDWVEAAAWREGGLGCGGSRVEFWIGEERVGVVTAAGMRVRRLVEGAVEGDGFGFGGVAGLGVGGMVASAFLES